MNINKLKVYLLALSVLMLFGIGSYIYLAKNLVLYKTSSVLDREIFNSYEQLVSYSPLIVEAWATDISKPYVTEGLQLNYTKTEVVIDKVLKGDLNPNIKGYNITVIEGYYTRDNKGIIPGKTIISLDEYTPMVPGAKYLLFLSWSDARDGYWIVANHVGKMNLDSRDKREHRVAINSLNSNSDYGKIRKKALLIYR